MTQPARYARFGIIRPVDPALSEDYWASVTRDLDRVLRAMEANDGAQTLDTLKCLVETVAKIALDMAGRPAAAAASFKDVVNGAHQVLTGVRDRELAQGSTFGNLANSAKKIAADLGEIRNAYGSGHGRARDPRVADEMVDLALDGALMWVRWAVRRLGLYALGRPEPLIRDLIGPDGAIFYSGTLRQRLLAANLPSLEPDHQRAIGVAVGRRAASGTFVVRHDGVDRCLESDDLDPWTPAYRAGVAHGLLFGAQEEATFTWLRLRDALLLFDPVADASTDLSDFVDTVTLFGLENLTYTDETGAVETVAFLKARRDERPDAERAAYVRLIQNIQSPEEHRNLYQGGQLAERREFLDE